MRINIVILTLIFLPLIMKSQNATATLGNISSCAGENVLVALDVNDFIDVGAMTIYIGYDTNAAEFLALQNINPAIPGGISVYAINGQVNIAYSNMEPFTITGEKLFDLSFTFLGGSTQLSFNPGTEIANSNLEVIPLDTYPGSIENSIVLTNQPDSIQSYPDNDVTFRVTSLGNPNYQWQENTGNGWINLQNNETYEGAANDTLIIHDVTLELNGNTYRCVLTANECTTYSEAALLEVATAYPVATLGYISACPENEILEPLFVGDFFDVIEFTFNISFDTESLTFLDLENIHPDLLQGTFTVTLLNSPPGIAIHWEDSEPVSLTSATLFDLLFSYESGDQIIGFEEGTSVLNSFLNQVNVTLNDGSILQFAAPLIITQPQDETVMEFDYVNFSVEALGAIEYKWMVSTDDGGSWTNLSNTPPYFNIQTATLTINPATYNLNGYRYACNLSSEYCSVISFSALLTVDTLTYIPSFGESDLLKISPVPFRDKIHVDMPPEMTCNSVSIINVQGRIYSDYTLYNYSERNGVIMDLSFLPLGIYIIKVEGIFRGKEFIEQRKIVKTN